MAVTILRPNAAGNKQQWDAEGGDYTRVDEATSDGDTTRLYTPTADRVATFNLDASGLSGVVITAVKVYIMTRGLDAISNSVQLAIRTGGTDYFSSTKTYNNTSYHLESATWAINPNTGVAWTISDVDALEAGMKRIGGGGQAVTQVYVEVYTATAALAGTLSSGADEADIVAGGGTITLTLTDATFVENGYSADLCTGGTSFASHENLPNEGHAKAFDDNFTSTKWLALNKSAATLGYRFGSSAQHLVLKYTITSGNDEAPRDPKDWTLQGSNDGSSWTTVDTITGETFASRLLTKEFVCDTPGTTAYEYYRLNITANNGGAHTQIEEVQMFAAGTTFDDIRDDIIAGLDSAQSEGTGWDAVVKAGQTEGGVVRTSATVVTITFDAFASYNISAQETITATIPSAALVDSAAIVASPTFDIDTVSGATDVDDSRSAAITGYDVADSARGAAITGVDDSDDSRVVRITGFDTESDSRGVAVTGEDDSDDSRGVAITGEDSQTDSRAVSLSGSDTEDDSRTVAITGSEVEDDSRSVSVHGFDTDDDSRGVALSGEDDATDSRSVSVTGIEGTSDSRDVALHGFDSADDSRGVSVSGSDSADDSRGVAVTGVSGAVDSRAVTIHGEGQDNDSRQVAVTGSVDSSDSRSVAVSGEDTSDDSRAVAVTGFDDAVDSRAVSVTGSDTLSASRGVAVTGADGADDSRGVELTGFDDISDSRGVSVHGSDEAGDSRSVSVTGVIIASGSDSRGVSLTGYRPKPYTAKDPPYSKRTSPYGVKDSPYSKW